MKAFKIKIRGKVLRTGYRWYIVDRVREKDLAGYIEFTPEGGLLLHLQGEDDLLQEAIEKIRNPPQPTVIKEFSIEEVKPDPKLKVFTIKYGTIGDELHEGFGPIQFELEYSLKNVLNSIEDIKKTLNEMSKKMDQLYQSYMNILESYIKSSGKQA
ncbi:MAG: acylphosphatase [Thaumarchaeota archaeon]|jgi:acylphosphatase|nr:acylphosphatase [Candidatus Geocrenenecus arthurdayi]